MLDGYENPDPTAKPPYWADLKVPLRPISPISQRILTHVNELERTGRTARHSSFVVIPAAGLWKKMGNKTFYRLFNLNYLQHTRKKNGLQEAIDKAKSRVFIKDSSYNVTTALALKPGIALEGESMPQVTNVEPNPPESLVFTTNANGDTGTVLTTTGSNDCFTGTLLRTVSVENMGLSNFTNGFNIGAANVLGIAQSVFQRIMFSSVALPLNLTNFQMLELNQIYGWLPTTNFIRAVNNNSNWFGGNSLWFDTFAHGCKNVNGAVSLIATSGYLNMIESHRMQVNMEDAAFSGSTSGYGLYLSGASTTALCQNNEFYGLDIEASPLDTVRLEDWSLFNYIHLAYSIRQSAGFDFSLQKSATTQAPYGNLLVFHSNVGGGNCKVQSDNFDNFLMTSLPLLPVTGSYPSGISGVGTATFGGVHFTTMFGGGSGQAMVGHATANIPGGTQTGPITIGSDQVPEVQSCEVGFTMNVTAYTSGTIQVQATFSDQNSNAQTVTVPMMRASDGAMVTGATATGWYSGYVPICSKANTNYSIKTVGTFTASYYCSGFLRATG